MAIEAPISKYKKHNLLIFMVVSICFAGYFTYDGYYNQKFISDHTLEDGSYDDTLVFNRKAPPYCIVLAVIFAVIYFKIKDKKLIADDKVLILGKNDSIGYESIISVDKTLFDEKGFFVIKYTTAQGEGEKRISDRTYDNLGALLEKVVSEIS